MWVPSFRSDRRTYIQYTWYVLFRRSPTFAEVQYTNNYNSYIALDECGRPNYKPLGCLHQYRSTATAAPGTIHYYCTDDRPQTLGM